MNHSLEVSLMKQRPEEVSFYSAKTDEIKAALIPKAY